MLLNLELALHFASSVSHVIKLGLCKHVAISQSQNAAVCSLELMRSLWDLTNVSGLMQSYKRIAPLISRDMVGLLKIFQELLKVHLISFGLVNVAYLQ